MINNLKGYDIMKMPIMVALQRVNRALVRKYGEEVALERFMNVGEILFEYIDEEENISKEFYDKIMKNI